MSSDPKYYFVFFSWRNIRAWAYYKMALSRQLKQFGANRILNIHITNSNWKPLLILLKVFDISMEVWGDRKKIISVLRKTNLPSSCMASEIVCLPGI